MIPALIVNFPPQVLQAFTRVGEGAARQNQHELLAAVAAGQVKGLIADLCHQRCHTLQHAVAGPMVVTVVEARQAIRAA